MRWHLNNLRRRFFPGLVCAIAIPLLYLLGLLQPLEQLGYQALFLLRGEQPWDSQVVVIAIDEHSLKQLGRFPWNRKQYVKLLNVLTRSDASVVAFDLIWSEKSAEDPALATAMNQHQRVVLAHAADGTGIALPPVRLLSDAAIAIGHIQKRIDADGMTRSVAASSHGQFAFAIEALRAYFTLHDEVPLPAVNSWLTLNWLTSARQIPTYSFAKVIAGQVPLKTFQDKIVFVGFTAVGVDPLVTPFDRNPPTSNIYLHATLATNLLQNTLLQIVPRSQVLIGLGLFSLGLSAWLDRWQISRQILIGLGCAIAWLIVCLMALHLGHLWLPLVTPILLIVMVVSGCILQERLSLNRVLHRQVKDLWNTYYNDLVNLRVEESELVTHKLQQQPISMQRAKQLAVLAEQFGRSHAAQAAIARNLSLGLLAADLDGFIWFSNPVAMAWLDTEVGAELQAKLIPQWMPLQQWQSILQTLHQFNSSTLEITQFERWFELRFEPLFYRSHDPAPSGLLLILEDITARKQAAIALQIYADTQADLNHRLTEQTLRLELVNQELEAFSYAVSHDLRAPLRRIEGFNQMLLDQQGLHLDEEGKTYLNRIDQSVKRMRQLIEDLLKLSRIVRIEMYLRPVDLSAMCVAIAQELQQQYPERSVKLMIHPHLNVCADERLLRIALENLLSNAWKYTNNEPVAEIEVGELPPQSADNLASASRVFFIRDNGIGFDMSQVNRLFGAFQRLHSNREFTGTGIGLMTTRRIIHRHQGQIWAEAVPQQGATFYFTLPDLQ